MNIYLVEWDHEHTYEDYVSFVVCCDTEETARTTYPGEYGQQWWVDHPEEADGWVSYSERTALKVTLLGHAAGGVLAGVKCTNNVGS